MVIKKYSYKDLIEFINISGLRLQFQLFVIAKNKFYRG
jgi:phage gp29-like protein